MKLFLDDYRSPIDCFPYMWQRIGNLTPMYNDGKWRIVRNYPEFISAINKFKGEITHISFDHDLVDGHYQQNVQVGVRNKDVILFCSATREKNSKVNLKIREVREVLFIL